MVAQFPEVVNTSKAYLTPKISISAKLNDVGTSSIENGVTVSRYSRIAEITVEATGIKIGSIRNTIDRIFSYLADTITNAINVPSPAALPLNAYSQPLDKPELEFSFDVDRTSSENQVVNLSFSVINLQSDFIDETFSKTKDYILDALREDLNPPF